MIELDHVAIAGETLEAATAHVEDVLGVSLQPGGAHDVFFTHNRLLGLEDGLYLEAIAVNPAAPQPDRPRWFDLDRFCGEPRLTNWICRTVDLDDLAATWPAAIGAPVRLQRGDLRWQMAVPDDGVLPFDNMHPALIAWETDLHPATMLRASGCRLRQLVVGHPQAADLQALLSPYLSDDRLRFEPSDQPVLRAEFETPHGRRIFE